MRILTVHQQNETQTQKHSLSSSNKLTHVHTPLQHPHSDDSHVSQSPYDCSSSVRSHFQSTRYHPSRSGLCPDQTVHSWQWQWHDHSPFANTPHWHQSSPRSSHIRCPMCCCGEPQLFLNSLWYHQLTLLHCPCHLE